MKPMLLTEYPDKIDLINSQPYVFIQPKLDGWRGMINTKTGEIFLRSDKKVELPHITDEILKIKNMPEWIDGELYTHGYTLGQIQSMIKLKDERIQFHCFDVVSDKGFSSRQRSIVYNMVDTYSIRPSEIMKYYNDFLSAGYEGAVIRIDGQPYHQYRSDQVIKIKPELVF